MSKGCQAEGSKKGVPTHSMEAKGKQKTGNEWHRSRVCSDLKSHARDLVSFVFFKTGFRCVAWVS